MSDVRGFWDQQARDWEKDPRATAPDVHYRNLEIRETIRRIGDGGTILDVGCGNGFSTVEYARRRPNASFIGMDYSEEMIKSAIQHPRVQYITGDVLGEFKGYYEQIVSVRCLINLASEEEQFEAVDNLMSALKPGGQLILVENVTEGLMALNSIRSVYKLPPIEVRWHNKYISMLNLSRHIEGKYNCVEATNIGGFYYLISRVVYAAYAGMLGEEIRYDHPLNEIASKLSLPTDIILGPNMLMVLENKQ